MIFLFKQVIFRFHVNFPGYKQFVIWHHPSNFANLNVVELLLGSPEAIHQQASGSIFGWLVTKDLMIGRSSSCGSWKRSCGRWENCRFDAATSFSKSWGNSVEDPFLSGEIPAILIIEHQPELRAWPLRSFKQEKWRSIEVTSGDFFFLQMYS